MSRGARQQRRRLAPAPGKRNRCFAPVCASRPLRLETLEDRRLLAIASGGIASLGLDDAYVPTGLLVQFRPETQYAGSLGGYVAGKVVGSPWEIAPGMREVEIAPGMALDEALAAFAADPHVLFAEPDYRVQLKMLPDDPDFSREQWYLNNTGQIGEPGSDVRAPAAWDITTGSPSVVVAVIDTGVDYNHPDLAANMWRNDDEVANDGIDNDNNGYVDDIYGYDFLNRDFDPMDDHLHGTHVAGTIAAVANNGIGVSGVAPGVRIMALKFLDATGNGLTSDAIAALNYAVANEADISNNSFGGGPLSQAFKTAIQNANGAGHIFVAAAGNYGSNNDTTPFYPASYESDNVITVAATDAGDHIAWFSNYGKKSVDLGAPGVDIYSTFPSVPTPQMIDRGITEAYGILSGTSMAAPIVSGVLALVRSQNDGLSAREVIDQVLATVDRSPSLVSKTASGGRVNAAAALGLAPIDEILPRVVSSDPSGTVAGPISQVRLKFSEPMDASTFLLDDVLGMNGPLGPVTILAVEPSLYDDREFIFTFLPQTEPGAYSLLIGPHIQDLAGNELDQDGDGVAGVDGADEYSADFAIVTATSNVFASTDVPLDLHGFEAITSYLTILEDLPIADINVQLHVTFPRVGNLHVWLVSPSETVINLSYGHGGESENFADTIFDDEAEVALFEGEAPFTGSFQPDDSLGTLNVENAQGTWQLVIQNVSETNDFGSLNAWALEIVRRESGGGGGGGEVNDPPIPGDDHLLAFQSTPLEIAVDELLANDTDPDDDALELTSVRGAVGGTVELNDGTISFVPGSSGLGLASFEYTVSDGVHTSIGNVLITLRPRFQLHNGLDVNDDGFVTAFDALLVINYLNAYGPGPIIGLGIASTQKLFYDVFADNVITATDPLTVINHLNANGSGLAAAASSLQASTASGQLDFAAVDECLMLCLLSDVAPKGRKR